MSEARNAILARIREARGRGPLSAETARQLEERVTAHRRNLVPRRAAALDRAGQVDLFVAMAEEVQTSVARVASAAAVPEAVARYLASENLPAELVMAPDPTLDAYPWNEWPMLAIRRAAAAAGDAVSLTPCLAAIAETGTLMLTSGPERPTTLNFLPDTHIVVLRAAQVVACYEDGWDLLRAAKAEGLPRTVNLITGPSRTGDIEQRIQLGAHGPRRLHIILVEEERVAGDGEAEEPGGHLGGR
ncbi:MAG: LUD domain-containing protein [Alphaproteobacteria bacterium]|nr:LUD domain-containing protein [Alphaproteobacteria bacterium]